MPRRPQVLVDLHDTDRHPPYFSTMIAVSSLIYMCRQSLTWRQVSGPWNWGLGESPGVSQDAPFVLTHLGTLDIRVPFLLLSTFVLSIHISLLAVPGDSFPRACCVFAAPGL